MNPWQHKLLAALSDEVTSEPSSAEEEEEEIQDQVVEEETAPFADDSPEAPL